MKTDLYNQSGEVIGDVELPDKFFGVKVNNNLVHEAVVAQMANRRQVLAHTKDRGEVRGGGIKPWRQKGTGRARHGSIRSPIWAHGGVAFGPTKNRNFSKKINKRARQAAVFMVLSSKLKSEHFMVVDQIKLNEVKTKEANNVLSVISDKFKNYKKSKIKKDPVLIVMAAKNPELQRTFRNLPFVDVMGVDSLNVVDLLKNKYLLMMKDSIQVMEKHYK
ncbi:MAG: 50S ribosomal protein L4 [bacterium]|nr:50S ribosomal protein L4 [bacterium]